MDALTTLLAQVSSQPITQFGALAAVLFTLHKRGVINLRVLVRSLMGIDDSNEENSAGVMADMRSALQPLLSAMEQLTQYANHETTGHLSEVKGSLDRVSEKQDMLIRSVEGVTAALNNLQINGIRCRKD